MRIVVGALRLSNLLSVICNDPFLKSPLAHRPVFFGDDDGHGVGNCKHAPVEKLVMERAQGEAVALLVGTAGLMPFDVSGRWVVLADQRARASIRT